MKKKLILLALSLVTIKTQAQWQLLGNAGTNPTTQFVGTTDAKDLRLRTNNSIRMNITSAGKIGINTIAPSWIFDVKGGSMSTDSMYRINGQPAVALYGNGNYYLFQKADSLTSGFTNIVIGNGGNSLKSGNTNILIGNASGYSLTSGFNNVSMGFAAGIDNSTCNDNVNIGMYAGNLIKTGSSNTMIGNKCKGNNVTSNSVAVGYFATVSNTNSIAIGSTATSNSDNKIRLGNSAITNIEGQVAFSFPSDGRFKINVKENIPGMDFINKLRPVTYNFEAKKFDEFIHQNDRDFNSGNTDYAPANEIVHSGFIAQEVEQVAKELNYNFDGVNAPKHAADNYSMSYELLVVPMIKGMQELDKKNTALVNENNELRSRLEKIEALLNVNKQGAEPGVLQKITLASGDDQAVLGQNHPNPFNGKTVIQYYLPGTIKSASLVISSANGSVLKTEQITGRGQGSIELDATQLANGNYFYSLIADDKQVDTKKFNLTR